MSGTHASNSRNLALGENFKVQYLRRFLTKPYRVTCQNVWQEMFYPFMRRIKNPRLVAKVMPF